MIGRLSIVSKKEIDALSHAIGRIGQGSLQVTIPPTAAALEPVRLAVEKLKRSIVLHIEDLDSERHLLYMTLNSVPDAVFVFDGDTIAFMNDEARTAFALHDFHIGQSLSEVGLPVSLATHVDSILTSGCGTAKDLDPDPLGRAFRVVSACIDANTNPPQTLVIITDITSRIVLDRVRTDFVAAASHELKTPVAGIELVSETALLALQDGNIEAATAFVEQLRGEAQNLRRLVADLLDLSRFENTVDSDSVCDIHGTVHNTMLSHTITANAKNLDLACDFSGIANEDIYVKASPTDVAIILDNLVDNAVAYTDAGEVLISVEATDDTVSIEVSDSGIGIPPEEMSRIFERFYRIDKSRSRVSGGTGLGLALVKHSVERLGGSIEVDSIVGDGSRFVVTLPRAK